MSNFISITFQPVNGNNINILNIISDKQLN